MNVNNGLQHAVSLGTIDSTIKTSLATQIDRNYDSDDGNSCRRKIRHMSSMELYAKPSQYSKFDIREQYCLTDRQLNTIECSRRDRFFGCLSGRATPQSLLGGCVGRRAPSDENLAVYAPFYKYPRYPHPYLQSNASVNPMDLENFYFRRQPASILSTSKIIEPSKENRMYWPENESSFYGGSTYSNNNKSYLEKSSLYEAPPIVSGISGRSPRTKHVSFARSHTLTSFDDMNVGFRSSQYIKSAKSQERLLGSKITAAYNPCYETIPAYVQQMPLISSTSPLRVPPRMPHMQNVNSNHNHLGHIHHKYLTVLEHEKHLQTQQLSVPILASRPLSDDITAMTTIPAPFPPCSITNIPASVPINSEVIVIEKKFRHAMKTQATQTIGRKPEYEKRLELSPHTGQRVKVVSQGAQTNGLQNGKSPTQISPKFKFQAVPIESIPNNEMTCRMQSQESQESQIKSTELNFSYYQPPGAQPPPLPPQEYQNENNRIEQQQQVSLSQKDDIFSYESNSLPRRSCGYRLDTDFHSLPRRDFQNMQDICKHITECSEILGNVSPDLMSDLLPPPQEYCHDEEDSLAITQTFPKDNKDYNRRKSLVPIADLSNDSPFRRDDIRRQSMPAYFHKGKLFDFKRKESASSGKFSCNLSNEKEIIIDFKPLKRSHKSTLKQTKQSQQYINDSHIEIEQQNSMKISENFSAILTELVDESDISHDPIYENVPADSSNTISEVLEAESSDQERISTKSAPCSPLKGELLPFHPSAYPSSDSLANDNTRDHSEGNWNESEVTVLIAEQRSETSINSHHLLTPSTRRKYLLLQHQQRSSIDTEAFDLEEQFTDQSPTYSQISNTSKIKPPVVTPRESTMIVNGSNLPKLISPSIEVTTAYDDQLTSISEKLVTTSSPRECRRNSNASLNQLKQLRSPDKSSMFPDQQIAITSGNADISECSTNTNTNTNTEEYATCTDTSKHIAGIRIAIATTTTTTTSSSSITQMPVSTHSSQMDRTNAESSFESASSLHSSKCDAITDDLELNEDPKVKADLNLITYSNTTNNNNNNYETNHNKSPKNSISSPSSGSCNRTNDQLKGIVNIETQDIIMQYKETIRIKMESISDDERSEIRYSSSGYYESPQDDEYQKMKIKRYRSEEERRRRKSSMKIDIEKENMRALMSPIKREQIARSTSKPKILQSLELHSPVRLKRFRPKIRRQLRRLSRDDIIAHKLPKETENSSSIRCQSEAIPDAINLPASPLKEPQEKELEKSLDSLLSPFHIKTLSETHQLKDKSIESLNRSVSPGSDSVFYSEADININIMEQKNLLNTGESKDTNIEHVVHCDSVESLPYIDNEPDIVKPPSDFADSPTINKAAQRLYKKMDKRLRSEERYTGGERGRHYKYRKENNIRAKSEERNQEMTKNISTTTLRMTGSSPCILPESSYDIKQQTIYIGHYDCSRYTRLTDSDIWIQLNHQSLERNQERRNSTESERSFCAKYQVILHRLVQRRCTLEMYRRQKSDIFKLLTSKSSNESLRRKLEELLKLMFLVWAREGHVIAKLSAGKYGVDKTVVVKSDSGEFGFRIHGSKPVVVAAIEPETPAESSGLEVGDIIISVNGVQVLDKHHTEVVKIAHDGCEKLELEVARTLGVLMNERQEPPIQIIYSGHLWRQSGQARGSPNTKKWVQRWFVLRSDNCLYYYKTEEDTQPVGAMIMAKHQVEICSPKIGKRHAFKVDCGEGIPLYLAADTEELTNKWLSVLKNATTQGNSWLDKSSRNLYKTPSSITRSDCCGYLMKLGSKWYGWSRRYCVLKDACLYFFQDINAKTALGMTCLHGYKVASISTSALGKRNSFEIIPPESKLRHYYFHTESDMEKKRWISALEYSIDRWIKSG